ncbi:DNA polymerase III subunit alpha [Aestuariibacter halophilus]|uniref:DNA polymerase III subunit alpha n=1 Tax=Fluctibacter halophilus TaxID=226011 RepID=A0ABS8GC85_9ALTE|nr:DNA polymerase III subunit alpha [Aestuariibacter halophilus]MCC2618179.1 DNA polymerase III subunit alpha [Aestuariibacter halophilus]
MADARFIHLRVHSDFSMMDGLNKVGPILNKVHEMNMPAVAITDQMNMCGLVKFYGGAHGKGIKPIIGTDFWVQCEELPGTLFRLTLLAQNNEGYKNITLLISEAYKRGHIHNRALIDKQWLADHSEGVIVLSGAKDGDVGIALAKGNQALTEQCLSFYQTHFPDRYYLELIRTGRAGEEDYLHSAVALAEQTGLPVVATNEVCFIEQAGFDAHEIRVCIHDGYTLDDKRRPKRYSDQQYLRSEAEMLALFEDIPEALQNTVEIAKRCNVTVKLGEYFLPQFPTGGMTTEDYLVKVSREGLERRLAFLFPDEQERAQKRPEYDERLQIELDVINQMGFPGYFLIVMEFIQWSKDNGIPVGPGRGSGAGSLVAYALDITDLDPLEFDLLFERFLNPERVSMPDFDVDFCMDRRDEVIDHVAELYGRQAVSQIITFGTMAAKAVVRDVGRVLGHPYGFVDRISKLIPPDPGMTLTKAFEVEPRLPELEAQDEDVKDLLEMARILEGVTRNAGKHAGGVVIAPTQITDFAPLYCDDEGKNPVTQFDKNDVETAGLVKFDFLGLRTLTIIQWAIDMIAQGHNKTIDISAIPLQDSKSFSMLQRAETTAVFQLESRGMKDLINRLKPDCFEDIIALVALFRPGPLQSGMVDNFIDRKHGREEISYPDAEYQHECLKEILQPTYGIILYQEQVMQIAQEMAGYSLGGADLLRRAMGKKKPEEMAKQRAVFAEGAENNNIDPDLAMKIFDLVEKFAGYGFNKSHSAAYALVSYQTLWLKAHYPAEFMAAVMSADMDNTDKIVTLVDECNRMGLTILPPDLNTGRYKFTVNEQGHIVYGIGAIKGVGEGPIEAIIEAREEKGEFTDLFDFCAKVDLKRVNRRVLEKLVLSGALDTLGPHRASLMATLPEALAAADQHNKAESHGQSDMFGLLTTEPEAVKQAFADVPQWPEKVWLDGEKETLGLYLTGHPINQYEQEIRHYATGRLVDLKPGNKDSLSTAVGLVLGVRVMTNKRGKRWAIVTLDDKSARMDVRFFPDMFEKYEEVLQPDRILLISGQVSFDDYSGGNTITARDAMDIVEAREKHAKWIELVVKSDWCNEQSVSKLQAILQQYQGGSCPMRMKVIHPDAEVALALGAQWYVRPDDELMYELQQVLSEEQVNLQFH